MTLETTQTREQENIKVNEALNNSISSFTFPTTFHEKTFGETDNISKESVGRVDKQNVSPENVDKSNSSVKNVNTKNVSVQNVEPLDVSHLRFYGWGKIPRIEKQDVVDGINNLQEPFNQEVTDLVKKGDVKLLQKYLNKKIDSEDIDGEKLKKLLTPMGIWLDSKNHILEDGKFGPQTLETLKILIKEKGKDIEYGWNPDWIVEEMTDEIKEIKATVEKRKGKVQNRSKGRNQGSEEYEYTYENGNFIVDKKNHKVGIATRGTKEYAVCAGGSVDVNNKCELDWTTGKMYAYAGNMPYELPFNIGPLTLDSNGNPVEDLNNKEKIQFFARMGNLVNFIKNKAVYNSDGALECTKGGGIEVNNGIIWGIGDDKEISSGGLDTLEQRYSHIITLGKEERIKLASLLTAMKLDLGKINWEGDVIRRGIDPLDKTHQDRVKYYLKNKSLATS